MTTGAVAPATRRSFFLFVLALVVLAGAYLGKALLGKVYVSTEVVYRSVQPWSGLEPAPPPVHNENLADQPTIWLSMQAATRAMVRDWSAGGEPPLHGPGSYCGSPWLGNMSSALFSPFTWLFVLLPFGPAFAICAAVKWLVAGVGTWLLARRLGASTLGATLAGLVFAFCGFQVVWIDSCLTNVSVWAPWLLLAIERVLARPGGGRVAVLALVGWQVLVGGHPETSLYVALGAGVFALARWLGSEEQRLLKLTALVVGAAIAVLLAVVQWWPFLEYALRSVGREQRLQQPDLFRAAGTGERVLVAAVLAFLLVLARAWIRRGAAATRAGRAIALLAAAALCVGAGMASRLSGVRPTLLMQLIPDWFGRSLDGGSYHGPLTYNDAVAGFCGGALFALASATALVRWDDRRVRALALVGIVVSARWFRLPLIEGLVDALPQVATTGASRALGIVALVVALLGAFAVDELRERPVRLAAWAGGLVLGLAALAFTRDDTTLALDPGESPPVSADGAGFDELPNLADGGPTGHGAEIRGRAPADAERVRLRVNGFDKAEIVPGPGPPDAGGLRPFHWRFVGSHRLEGGAYRLDAIAVDARGYERPFATAMAVCDRPARPSLRWGVHLLALAAVLLAAFVSRSARARMATLVSATLLELAFFGIAYNDTTPRERLPAAVEPLDFLAHKRLELGPIRVFTARNHLHPNLHLLFDVESLRGYDALEPVDYVHVLNELFRGHVEVPWFEMDFSTLDFEAYPGAWLADLMNVRFALSEERAPPGWREVWRRPDAQQSTTGPERALVLYENEDALPRAFTVQQARGILDVHASQADFRTLAAWDEPGERTFPGSARVVAFDHARGRMRATIESDAGTILIVSENVAGWRATIDGEPAEVRRTHGCFLSVVVPTGGRHDVELLYRPRSVTRGAWVSAAGALGLAALALAAIRARRRPGPEA